MGKLGQRWSSGMKIGGYHASLIQQDQEWTQKCPFQPRRIKASHYWLFLKILDQSDMGKLGTVLIKLFIARSTKYLRFVQNKHNLTPPILTKKSLYVCSPRDSQIRFLNSSNRSNSTESLFSFRRKKFHPLKNFT